MFVRFAKLPTMIVKSPYSVSEAQLAVARYAAQGKTQEQIAQLLGISRIAVRNRADRVRWNTNSENITEAVYKLTASGVLEITQLPKL